MLPNFLLTAIVADSMNNFFSNASLSWQEKRRAVFAGTWYEGDGKRLAPQLSRFLQGADEQLKKEPIDESFAGNAPIQGSVLAIVVPHAGYMFSGQTAAYSYTAALKGRKIKRVFLLGPSHYSGFPGAALPVENSFATPLGDLAVDREVIDQLREYPQFEVMPEVHRREHSLEMQLPFIRQVFGDVKIVPIIVGLLHETSDIKVMAQLLRRYVQPDDLIVVSSDFTHYGPRYDYEPIPGKVSEAVRKLDSEAFESLAKSDLPEFIEFKERTQDTICGFYPCCLLLAMLPKNSHASLLHYRTSQDSMVEDSENSVSYLALAFSDGNDTGWPVEDDAKLELTDTDKDALLKIARQALETYVRDGRELKPEDVESLATPMMEKPAGAFVTLYKKNAHGRDKELRGCIGYIFPIKSLLQAVIENAIGAASRDYRFHNVTADELDQLQIDVNVLTPPTRVKSYNEIVIGRDGVLLYKDGKQAVFLPSVATEFGWDLDQTLTQLCMKAGCRPDGWKSGAQFDVFQSISVEEHE
ncbi:MAG TPA: AmmeMemoRadiSam system protein B [Planktothrix sp.]